MAIELELPTDPGATLLMGHGLGVAAYRPPRGGALTGVAAGLAGLFAVVLAAVLLIVFAATLALVLVLSAALLACAAFAFRLGRPRTGRGRLGHSWIVYGIETRP